MLGMLAMSNFEPVATMASSRVGRIRTLNDRLRRTLTGGCIMLTSAVREMETEDRSKLLVAVQAFDQFDSGNDPYSEHDFGRVEISGTGYFWKIEYYDRDLVSGSADPADDAVTTRVMTIMREDEY